MAKQKGVYKRKLPSGNISWIADYTDPFTGKRRRESFAQAKMARARIEEITYRKIKGEPVDGGKARKNTIGEMVDSMGKLFPEIARPMRIWLQQRKTFLVLNMVKDAEDIKVGERFTGMVKKYLSIPMVYIGYVVFSPDVRKSIRTGKPLVLTAGNSQAADCFNSITGNLVALTKGHKE